MVTLKEIAQMCGVTPSTVSNVLNNKPKVGEATRKRVLEVVEQTGYQPNYFAQGMRKTKTNVIGIMTENLSLVMSTIPMVEAIMEYCENSGYRTILENMRFYDKWQDSWYEDSKRQEAVIQSTLRSFLSIRVDGIIYVAGHCRHINCFSKDVGVPSIMLYGKSDSAQVPSIILDDETGGYEMTKYLISMGHRVIGLIAGKEDNIHTQQRLLGYQRALFEGGVLYDPSLVRYGDWERKSGYQEAKVLVKAGVSAIFCMNDTMAGGVYDWLYDNDLQIGTDISVAGYDNTEIGQFIRPRLTTVDMHLKEGGRIAAERLLNELTLDVGKDTSSIVKVKPELVVRDSVRRLI